MERIMQKQRSVSIQDIIITVAIYSFLRLEIRYFKFIYRRFLIKNFKSKEKRRAKQWREIEMSFLTLDSLCFVLNEGHKMLRANFIDRRVFGRV